MSEPIRVVVGEGQGAGNPGLLRSVLERDGHQVLAEAASTTELARSLAVQQPDVVVLDDTIGVDAIQLVREICPAAKVVLVWPSAVVPVGADARVEPHQVLGGLAPAVSRVAGSALLPTGLERPGWVDKVRKDPSTLREMLATHGGTEMKRPSVTHLQRRARRLPPTVVPPVGEDGEERHVVAPLVLLPAGAVAVGASAAAAEMPAAPAVAEVAARNRRIGSIALGGAVAVGAAAIALAVGGVRIPTEILRPAAVVIPQPVQPGPAVAWPPDVVGGGGDSNGGGNHPSETPVYPPTDPGTTDHGGNVDGGGGGGNGTGGGNGGGGNGTGGGNGGGGNGTGGGNGGGGNGGGGGGQEGACVEESSQYADLDADDVCDDDLPGKSELHNPHGGPPGQTDEAPNGSQGDPTPGEGNGHDEESREARPHIHKR